MINQTLPREAKEYLESLASAASDLPPEVGSDLMSDIRAHLSEAIAAGRPINEVLRSLGPAEQVVAEVRDSLGLGADATRSLADESSAAQAHVRKLTRARTGLTVAAATIGLLTAVLSTFMLSSPAAGGTGPADPSSAQRAGLGLAAITLLPVLVAAVPLLLPIRHRAAGTTVSAVIVTLACFVNLLLPAVVSLQMFWLPEAMLLWAAVIVPWRMRRRGGRPANPAWRIAGAVVIAAPTVPSVVFLLAGSESPDGRTLATLGVSLVLAVLYALGVRMAQLALAVAAVVMLVSGVVQSGFLGPVLWLSTGLWITLGLGAFAATGWRLRTPG